MLGAALGDSIAVPKKRAKTNEKNHSGAQKKKKTREKKKSMEKEVEAVSHLFMRKQQKCSRSKKTNKTAKQPNAKTSAQTQLRRRRNGEAA